MTQSWLLGVAETRVYFEITIGAMHPADFTVLRQLSLIFV